MIVEHGKAYNLCSNGQRDWATQPEGKFDERELSIKERQQRELDGEATDKQGSKWTRA